MPKLGVFCVSRAVSGAYLTDFGKAACVSLLLVLSCVLSPAFAQDASAGCTPDEGSGTSSSPYRIDTLCELQGIRSSPTTYYELVANIDASETEGWNDGAGFEPIALNVSGGFSGSFVNASNYVISSLTISRSGTDYVGLFSSLAAGATIRGIILDGSHATGRGTVGSLVGRSDEGVIEGCSATGSVFGFANSIGGLVGLNEGNISDSYAAGSVVGGSDTVGGLVGYNQGNISNSYATGSVVGGRDNVGGLVGFGSGVISDSSATGSVVGGGDTVGGLIGSNLGVISNSYATGSVSAVGGIGGLVGRSFSGSISNSYATGSVDGQTQVGGLIGENYVGISNSYATGSVSGVNQVGGLAGQSNGNISNSYYAARGQNNGFGTERTFTQLRCPMTSSATCSLSGSDQRTYEDWDTNVWDFGSATDLPQLSSNRNSELNPKPYINGSADLVVMTGSMGTTQFSLVADYLGPSGEFVILTWSLSGVPTPLRHLVYFDLGGGTTSTTFTDSRKLTDGASTATLVVVGNVGLAGKSFHVVLKNDISANDDRIRVRLEEEKPYIRPDEDIRLAPVEGITTFSFSVGYAGPAEQSVTLTWSLEDVPTALNHLVYFDLGNDTTDTTFTDSAKFTGSASPVTLVVVGNVELAGRSFYVVLKNNVSANDDRVRVQVEGEPPNLVRDDDIRPALVGRTTTFSFSVGYTGSSVPVTLTWSLEDVPTSLRHLVYFDLGNDTTDTTVTDSGRLTGSASTVTLVVVGNEELSGKDFYVVLKNNVVASDDRVLIQVLPEEGPPNIVRDDDIRPAPIGSTSTFGFSVGYTGFSGPVTLTWSLSGVPTTLRHLVYFDLGGGTTSTTVTDSARLTGSASTVTLVVVGDEELAGRSFYVVLKNNISASDDRVQVRTEVGPPNIVRDDDIRPVPIGSTTTFGFSVGYTGSSDPVTLTWSLSDVPSTLRHLVYFDLGGGTTGTTVTDSAKLTSSASPVTLVVVGDEGLEGRSFYVVLKNNVVASDDRVQVLIEEDTPNILGGDDSPVPIGSTTTFSFSVGYTGSSDPVTLTWSLSGVPNSLRHLVYFDLGGGTTSTTVTDGAKLTSSARSVMLTVVGNVELAGISFYVVLKNSVVANEDRVRIQVQGPTAIRLRAKVYLGGAVR